MKSKNNGITLITLIITIILLLILVGIIINLSMKENGIFNRAKQAAQTYKMQSSREKLELAILSYQTNQENTTLLEEIRKIEGINKITTSEGELPYIVIIDKFEFIIDEELKVEFQEKKEILENELPEIFVDYEKEEVYNLTISIIAKTKDSLGLKQIIVSRKIENGSEEKYQDIKVEKIIGQEKSIQVEIPMNGNYVIQAYGQNGTITKQEIIINNIKEGSILATISAGTVIDNHVELTINGKSEGSPIKQMHLYVGGERIKTYEYEEQEEEKEEQYTLENIEFYKDTPCYVKVINKKDKVATSVEVIVTNTNIIANIKDLENLAIQVNKGNTFKEKTIYLINEITTKSNWIPIGYYDGIQDWTGRYFSGTFEGNNHKITITSVSQDSKYKSTGLFGMIIGGTINNLIVEGTIDNRTTAYVGGITGGINNGTINNCNNMARIYGKTPIGGITGFADEKSKINNCINTGTIKCYQVLNVSWLIGNGDLGIAGGIVGQLHNNSKIEGCKNNGEVTADTGTILPKGVAIGGIAGWAYNSNIEKCNNKSLIHFNNTSNITRDEAAIGGIVGGLIKSNINQCYNTGTVTSKYNTNYGRNNVGGIAGLMLDGSIINVYNTGNISGKLWVGGIVGQTAKYNGTNYIYNCYNATKIVQGDASGTGNLVGLSGNINSTYVSYITGENPLGHDTNSNWSNYKDYTLVQMKTMNSGLLSLINQGYGSGLWKQSTSINSGLPYLVNNMP